MHCISSYPTDIKNANLINIKFLRDMFNINVGYSNHVLGTTACEIAIALGARIIEFHFTDNKKTFIDHKISLEPKDFDILRKKSKRNNFRYRKKRLQQFKCEKNYKELRKGLIYNKDLLTNHKIKDQDIDFARPQKDFSYNEVRRIIGLKLKKDVKKYFSVKKRFQMKAKYRTIPQLSPYINHKNYLTFKENHKFFIKELKKELKKDSLKLIDIGCGNGQLLYQINKKFPYINCTGTDREVQFINSAKKFVGLRNVNFMTKDFLKIEEHMILYFVHLSSKFFRIIRNLLQNF